MLKAPFSYFGAKSKVASLVWSRLGDVNVYNEPFYGGFGVFANGSPAVGAQECGGYGNTGEGQAKENAKKERIWFSPSCLKAQGDQLFLFDLEAKPR